MTPEPLSESSDRDLVDRCRRNDSPAVDALVERYATFGVAVATRLAAPNTPADRVLEVVHDALVTAFDEALEGDVDTLAPCFNRLVAEFASATRSLPAADSAPAAAAITGDAVRQLRLDLQSELQLTIALHTESPRTWRSARRILQELRMLRRRLRLERKAGILDRVHFVVADRSSEQRYPED